MTSTPYLGIPLAISTPSTGLTPRPAPFAMTLAQAEAIRLARVARVALGR